MTTMSLAAFTSNPVPVILMLAPCLVLPAGIAVIVGAAPVTTVKLYPRLEDPAGDVTEIGPVVAPDGTTTVIEVDVTALGVAATPLKDTDVLEVVPKPVPPIVTVAPTAADAGEAPPTTIAVVEEFVTDKTLPAAS